jgi:hypothetical protein
MMKKDAIVKIYAKRRLCVTVVFDARPLASIPRAIDGSGHGG